MTQVQAKQGAREEAVALLQSCGSLLFGDFTLASGRKSDYYFDSKLLTLDPRGAYFVAQQLLKRLENEDIEGIGGMAYSAIPIVANICMLSYNDKRKPLPAFYVRLSTKEHGRKKLVEGHPPLGGTKVAIVDDVVTTGDSILQAVHAAEEEGYVVSTVIAILDRNEGGREVVEDKGYKFWSLFTVARTEGGNLDIQFNGYPPEI